MITLPEGLLFAAIAVCIANTAAYYGASLWIDQLKSQGKIDPNKPNTLSYWDPFYEKFIEHFYTDYHLEFGSRFITRCVWVVRICTPLGILLIVSSCSLTMLGT